MKGQFSPHFPRSSDRFALALLYRRQPDKSMAFQPLFRLDERDSVDRIIWRASYKNVTPGGGNVT